jgi:hypothetical protein
MMTKRSVLLTGATGYIAGLLLPALRERYGWAKATYETLGFVYACGSLGRKLEIVQLRIVAPREIDARTFANRPLAHYLRDITGYISQRDLQQLFCKSIETPDIWYEKLPTGHVQHQAGGRSISLPGRLR